MSSHYVNSKIILSEEPAMQSRQSAVAKGLFFTGMVNPPFKSLLNLLSQYHPLLFSPITYDEAHHNIWGKKKLSSTKQHTPPLIKHNN